MPDRGPSIDPPSVTKAGEVIAMTRCGGVCARSRAGIRAGATGAPGRACAPRAGRSTARRCSGCGGRRGCGCRPGGASGSASAADSLCGQIAGGAPEPGVGARLPVRHNHGWAHPEAAACRRRAHQRELASDVARRIDADRTAALLDRIVTERVRRRRRHRRCAPQPRKAPPQALHPSPVRTFPRGAAGRCRRRDASGTRNSAHEARSGS